MMRDENRVQKCEKYLILLNKLAGVVQWQNGSFPSCIRGFDSLRPLQFSTAVSRNVPIALMIRTLEQAIARISQLPAADQEQIGRKLLSHVEKLNALRRE